MLVLKPLSPDRSVAGAKPQQSLSLRTKALYTHKLAYKLDSLVRVQDGSSAAISSPSTPRANAAKDIRALGGATMSLTSSCTAHCLLKTYCHTCDDAASTGGGVQQSRQDMVASLTSFSAISNTFTFLFKVLFTSPSWYLLAIGLEPMCSFR